MLAPGKVSLLCCPKVKNKERARGQEIEPIVLCKFTRVDDPHVSPPLGPASLGSTSQPPSSQAIPPLDTASQYCCLGGSGSVPGCLGGHIPITSSSLKQGTVPKLDHRKYNFFFVCFFPR